MLKQSTISFQLGTNKLEECFKFGDGLTLYKEIDHCHYHIVNDINYVILSFYDDSSNDTEQLLTFEY